jgi:fluoride exporter
VTTALLVALGAAVGAPARFLTDRWVQSRHDSVFPWGTFTVNVVASFVLGLVIGGAAAGGVPTPVVIGLGTGFCGALSTYSTFGLEIVRLAETGAAGYAVANALGSVVAGLGSAAAGAAAATVVWG